MRRFSDVAPGSDPDQAAARPPRWSAVLADTCAHLAGPLSSGDRDHLRGIAWPILRTVLAGFVRQHVTRLGPLSAEAIEDVAAEKSLELLTRCEAGAWNPRGWTAAQMSAFLSRVARNGVIDQLRQAGPRRLIAFGRSGSAPDRVPMPEAPLASPSLRVESAEYARHLIAGLRALKPRARVAWLLRVCFDWSSRRIAAHPEVALTPAHVDVELQRTRLRMRSWMEAAGHDVRELPPGTLALVWTQCVRDGSIPAIDERERP